jgi:hypothetical protein
MLAASSHGGNSIYMDVKGAGSESPTGPKDRSWLETWRGDSGLDGKPPQIVHE